MGLIPIFISFSFFRRNPNSSFIMFNGAIFGYSVFVDVTLWFDAVIRISKSHYDVQSVQRMAVMRAWISEPLAKASLYYIYLDAHYIRSIIIIRFAKCATRYQPPNKSLIRHTWRECTCEYALARTTVVKKSASYSNKFGIMRFPCRQNVICAACN